MVQALLTFSMAELVAGVYRTETKVPVWREFQTIKRKHSRIMIKALMSAEAQLSEIAEDNMGE